MLNPEIERELAADTSKAGSKAPSAPQKMYIHARAKALLCRSHHRRKACTGDLKKRKSAKRVVQLGSKQSERCFSAEVALLHWQVVSSPSVRARTCVPFLLFLCALKNTKLGVVLLRPTPREDKDVRVVLTCRRFHPTIPSESSPYTDRKTAARIGNGA